MAQKFYDIVEINEKIEDNLRKLILDMESKYRGQLFIIADRILSNRDINMVCIAGPSCAGKTTTARLLKEILEKTGRHVLTVSMDDFFIDREKTPFLPSGLRDLDSPKCINGEQMRKTFEILFSGKKTMFPRFDFASGKNIAEGHEMQAKYNSIIIFEGLHALNPLITKNLGTENFYKLYVDSETGFKLGKEKMNPVDLRLLRRMIRDIERRGFNLNTTLKNWEGVCDAEKKYIRPFKKSVDSVVDTTHNFELGIFKVAVEEMLKNTKESAKKIKHFEFLQNSLPVDKKMLPNTTLMWEFVDPPKEEEEDKEDKNI